MIWNPKYLKGKGFDGLIILIILVNENNMRNAVAGHTPDLWYVSL